MNIFSKQQNKMQEVENPDFARRPPAVICDVELPNIPEPFPNKSFHMAFVGRPGFGKTSLAINLIAEKSSGHRCYYRKFDEVYVMMPKGSLASLKDNPFESLPADNIYNDFTLENLYDLEMKLEENAEEDPPKLSLLFIDDLAADLKTGGELERVFKRLAYNRRHLRLSIINCVQRLTTIPKSVRATFSHVCFFKCTKNENLIMYDELIDMDKQTYAELCNYCFREKHDTIFVDLNNLTFYRNFNRLENVVDPLQTVV
jgi:DNA polymerase III delta prime subunit